MAKASLSDTLGTQNQPYVAPVQPIATGFGAGLPASVLSATDTSLDRKSTRLNSSHIPLSRMPSSA